MRSGGRKNPHRALSHWRARLITEHDWIAQKIARRVLARHPACEWSDLVQIARVGLVEAAIRFNPRKGPFDHFAWQHAYGEVLHYLVRHAGLIKTDLRRIWVGRADLSLASRRQAIQRDDRYWFTSLENPEIREHLVRPDVEIDRATDRIVLTGVLDALPVRERQAIILYCLCEFTQDETAELLGVAQKTIHRWVRQGLATLRANLDMP